MMVIDATIKANDQGARTLGSHCTNQIRCKIKKTMRTLSLIITCCFHKKGLIALACCLSRYCCGIGLALMVLLVGLPGVSFANTSATPMKFEYVFNIGGEPSFTSIQDRDGFLWFSSLYNGMVRLDGTSKG